jgi:hypothetical protein
MVRRIERPHLVAFPTKQAGYGGAHGGVIIYDNNRDRRHIRHKSAAHMSSLPGPTNGPISNCNR